MATKNPRIYRVTDKLNESSHLVKAFTKQAAVNHIVGNQFDADLPTQEELFAAAKNGAIVVDATVEPEPAEA